MQLLISCQPFPSISTFTLSRNARFLPICWDAAPLAHSSCPCPTTSPPATASHMDSCWIQVELWRIGFWLKTQIWSSGASMCSVWWAASGCWSFFQYLSPPSSLLFSSLFLASWPLQRSLFSVFTSEGGWILKPVLFYHVKYLSPDLGIVLQLAAFTCSMQCNSLEFNVIWWSLLDQQESWAPTSPFLSNHVSISLWRWASITWNHHACSSSGDWWLPLQVRLFHFSEKPIVMQSLSCATKDDFMINCTLQHFFEIL